MWVYSKKTYSDQMEIVVHMWFPFLLVICVLFSHFSFPMLSKSHHSKLHCHYCTIIYLPAFSANLLLVHLSFLWYLTLPFQPSNVQPSLWAGTSHPKSLWAICCLRSATTTNIETEQFSYFHFGILHKNVIPHCSPAATNLCLNVTIHAIFSKCYLLI